MSEYRPDCFQIVKINNNEEVHYKVLAGWSGGYLDGDSWKMNSGINSISLIDDYYHFSGYSGSVYICHISSEAMRMSIADIWLQLKEKYPDNVELVLAEDIKL